ncbi:unnamed protein product [Chironomus riparius]|uniref:Uncharacterized protein n=1 Tax=Chironomus riparius TaxID=315576 RepID=A0A9N9S8G9_9DIPT|nr:unnamed protein product [Chironomus riparius]
MTKSCPVLGCKSIRAKGSLHFFRFPKVSKKFGDVGRLWSEFTRRKNYKVLTDRFCQLHFDDECFKKGPKGTLRLKKGSVPTIYYKNGEKIVVPFNQEYQKYHGPEAERLFEETEKSVMNHEKELINLRYKKLRELKNLCRFCFMNSRDAKCIDMSVLASYSIDSNDMLIAMGCSNQYNSTFSDIICETCLLKVIDFYNFKKKCNDEQRELLAELEELDRKIHKVQKTKRKATDSLPWFKVEISEEPEDFQHSLLFNSTAHESIVMLSESFGSSDAAICHITVKEEDEPENEEYLEDNLQSDDEIQAIIENSYPEHEPKLEPQVKPQKESKRESYKDRYFECFFCRQKILSRIAWLKHKCPVKERQCDVPNCGKVFGSHKGYAIHIVRFHGMPKICSHYCPGCKTYYQMNAFDYKEHIKICENNKTASEEPIKCEICKKICKNLEAYSAHKLFHATEKLVESVDENGVKTFLKPKVQEKTKVCDLCGKTYFRSLREHKQNVHLVDFTGDMYFCDLCPVKKPTRRLIFDHMKSVHIIDWHRCQTCLKDFKSKRLLARHILYMHERHRLNIRCHICPNKPGFSATIYLEQHMRKHHGEQTASQLNRLKCDFGFCDATFSNQKTLDQHKVKMHGYYFQ